MIEQSTFATGFSWKGVIRWGGLALFAAGGIVLLFVVATLVLGQTMPVQAEALLTNPTRPTLLFLLAAIGELLLLPGALALYFALRDIRKTQMFIATGLWLLGVPLFLASRGLILSLSRVSERYLATADQALKAAYLASAEIALETQNMYAAMGLVLLCVASVMMGLVMRRSVFGRPMGALVMTAGVLSFFAPFAVMMHIPLMIPFAGLVLMGVWQVMAGLRLFRLGAAA